MIAQRTEENDQCITRWTKVEGVAAAAHSYFESRRARVDGFISRHFSLFGSLALHRKALGWDLIRAPANVALALPYFGARLAARIARSLGADRTSRFLTAQPILLKTSVAREVECLLITDLLELHLHEGDRMQNDVPTVSAALPGQSAFADLLKHVKEAMNHEYSGRLAEMITTYSETRAAAAEITTAIIMIMVGAIVLKQITPGAMVLGPALASAIAHDTAVASFPFGQTLGGLWYAVFPASAPPMLIFGTTVGLMAASAVLAGFAGVVADPLQRMLGLHRRRLLRLVDALEQDFNSASGDFNSTRSLYCPPSYGLRTSFRSPSPDQMILGPPGLATVQ